MGRPKEHDDNTRSALLECAGRILELEGPDAVSVRRVAIDAGTSTRAIYSLFGGKEGLLSAIYREMAATLAELHGAVPVREDVTTELLELCLAYRNSMRRHPSLYPVIFKGVPGFTPTEEDERVARQGLTRVVTALQRGLDEGTFVGRRAQDMANQLWALVHGLASLELKGALGGAAAAKRTWQDATGNLIAGFRTLRGG